MRYWMLNGFTNSQVLALCTVFIPTMSKKLLFCQDFSNSFLLCVPMGGNWRKSPIKVQEEWTSPSAKNIGSNGAMLISSMNSTSYLCACKSADMYVMDNVAPITTASSITCLRIEEICCFNVSICCSNASAFLESSLILFSKFDSVRPTTVRSNRIADVLRRIVSSKSAIFKERVVCSLCNKPIVFCFSL